jgi:hypothetical protein
MLCVTDTAELGAQHFRGAKQPAMLGEQDYEGGEGFAQMRTLQRFPPRFARLLRAGNAHINISSRARVINLHSPRLPTRRSTLRKF